MKKQEILDEIAINQAVIDDKSSPAYIKDAAASEILELKSKLSEIEEEEKGKANEPVIEISQQAEKTQEQTSNEPSVKKRGLPKGKHTIKPDLKNAGKRKAAEKEYKKLSAKYEKIKANRIANVYNKNENEHYHTENIILLAIKYGTPEQIKQAKDMYITHYIEGDASSIYKKRHELSEELWLKHIAAISTEKNSDKDIQKLRDEIEANKMVVQDKSTPDYLKSAAIDEIEELEKRLAKMQESSKNIKEKTEENKSHIKPSPKRGWPAGKPRGKRIIKPKLEEAKGALKPFVAPKRGRPSKKVGNKLPAHAGRAKQKNGMPLFPAIKVNKLLNRYIGKALHSAKIYFSIGATEGRHIIYLISNPSQIQKAYSIYAKLANEHDVKVNKANTITKV